MAELSKLQIRAKVMPVISEIKSLQEYSSGLLNKYAGGLNCIEDKSTLFSIFLKEYIKLEEKEYTFCACLLKEIIPADIISGYTLEQMKSKLLSDESKYKLVQLLRLAGISCDFNELPDYFKEPEAVIDLETKKLLEKATFNPESMLDFLDFVSAVSAKDRNILLKSLAGDYQGDMLANIIYPVLYSDFDDGFILSAVEILSDSKSSLAVAPFNYLIETSKNPNIIKACKTGLKKLKLAGASEEKAGEYFRKTVSGSAPAGFYATIPDGASNQAILISRKTNEGRYLLMASVINDNIGIVDTFGFYNISSDEMLKIIAKFYQSEGRYSIPPSYAKTRINEAVNVTINKKRKFPYEFICWKPLLSDIKPLEYSLAGYIKNNLKLNSCKKDEICTLLTKEHTFRWFISENDNRIIKSIFDKFYNSAPYNIELLNTDLKNNIDNIFDKETELLWRNKLYNLIYLLNTPDERSEAEKYYAILENDEFFYLFKTIIMQRSIFNYAVKVYENKKNAGHSANIFKRRNNEESGYDLKKLEELIDFLKGKWIDE